MNKLVSYIRRRLTPHQFIILSSIIVGFASGIMALALKFIVHTIYHTFIEGKLERQNPSIIFYPFIGLLLTVLFTVYFLKGNLERGIPNILYEIAKKSGFVKRHKIYSQVITSAITVGFGGSAGLEGPIVVTGAAIGSNIASELHWGYKERVLLLGCGTAAGIAAVFNAPIAGMMFAIEILITDISVASFAPLAIAAACGMLCSTIAFHEEPLFTFKLQQKFDYTNIPYYFLLAAFTAFVSLYYAKTVHLIESFFEFFGDKRYLKLVVGGLLLTFLIYSTPTLFGEGYAAIKQIAGGKANFLTAGWSSWFHLNKDWTIVIVVLLTMLLKAVATTLTLSSGGNGGNFAPSLFVGAHAGFLFSRVVNLLHIHTLPESNFTIVGMAGVLSGVMYAPLTAIFLIAEITGGYDLMIPLMIVSSISFAVAKHYEPFSMETRKLAAKGKIFTHNRDHNILMQIKLESLIETDIKSIFIDQNLGDLVRIIAQSNRNIFAVTDIENVFVGVITLDNVREMMFQTELYEVIKVKQLMNDAPVVLKITDEMNAVMSQFEKTDAWNLPVVDSEEKYLGFLSKSSVFSHYRSKLVG